MAHPGWITLNDYSNQYKVSISTLRRRIRADEVEYRMEGGRYWLANKPIDKYVRNRNVVHAESSPAPTIPAGDIIPKEDVMDVAREMMTELKSAYVHSLQEKEEQILQLKGEVADLKTLVKILEGQSTNKRQPVAETMAESTEDLDVEAWS